MARVWVVLAVVEIAFLVFSIVDVALTDGRRARGVPKAVWLLIVLLLIPPVGGILWFWIGKAPLDSSFASGSGSQRLGPDDDPSFLGTLTRDEEQDERIRQLEQELADLDDDPPTE
jgi:hypothetical protein